LLSSNDGNVREADISFDLLYKYLTEDDRAADIYEINEHVVILERKIYNIRLVKDTRR
jgi:hypothetical protein